MGLRGQKYQKVASRGFSRGLQPRGASAADFYALILALLVLLCESPAFASDVHLAWDANSETTLSGYKDRKSTRLNSSHITISYAVFCLKKKNNKNTIIY